MICSYLKTKQMGENAMKSLAESSLNTSPLKDELKAIAREITTLLPGAEVLESVEKGHYGSIEKGHKLDHRKGQFKIYP